MVKKSIKRLVVAGIVSVLVVANSIIAFASSHDFDGYAGSCHYSGGDRKSTRLNSSHNA